jgi:dUTP pyrophosphatase
MQIKKLHHNFVLPIKSTERAGAFDIYMPDNGSVAGEHPMKIKLGFSAAVPEGHVALLLPRSSAGANYGVELNNTCGVIDSDYRGEWMAVIRTKSGKYFNWDSGERLLQFLIVPIADVSLELVEELDKTKRGTGGFGSTGK